MGVLKYLQESIDKQQAYSNIKLMTPDMMEEIFHEIFEDISIEDYFELVEDDKVKKFAIEAFVDKSENADPHGDEDGVVFDRFNMFLDSDMGEALLDQLRTDMEDLAKDEAEEKKYGHPAMSAAERNR